MYECLCNLFVKIVNEKLTGSLNTVYLDQNAAYYTKRPWKVNP